MNFPDDAGLVAVLTSFGVTPDAYLGHGGEAWVYALDNGRVLRVLHEGGRVEHLQRRQALVDELGRAQPPFALPELIETAERAGRVFVVERRLTGRSLMDELRDCEGDRRRQLIEAHLATAAALGDLHLDRRDTFRDLLVDDPIVTPTWHEYLVQRADANIARSLPEFQAIDAVALADALPDATTPAFVHLDAFSGNMLTDGNEITAVLDFGATSIAGDRRLEPVAAAVYLASTEITPVATPADVDVAMSWLRAVGLGQMFEPARRWLAAYWTFAWDDPNVLAWCRRVLLL